MTIASLAMYPFTNLRGAWEQLWDGVGSRLSVDAPPLDWDVDPLAASRRDDLLLGQTCAWPLVTQLGGTVRVVGTFDCDVDGASHGTYCSVIVSNSEGSLDDILHRPDLIVAANSPDSLSGWISLRVLAAGAGVDPDTVVWTGAHASSIEALRDGRAHLAAIDAVSWEHLGGAGTKVSIVGHGLRIPSLPLVTSGSTSDALLGELRLALAATTRDPAMADACATLKIGEFLVRDLGDYEAISELAELW